MKLVYSPHPYSQQRQKEKPAWVYPVIMAMEAEYHRKAGDKVYWRSLPAVQQGSILITEPEGIPFLKLPYPDRVFTQAKDPVYQSYGNYKYHPATHMQVANGCWWGKCVFCVEKDKKYEVRSLDHVMEEIDDCHRLGFKEIFDDSGTFPIGEWLERFCIKMRCKPYKMVLGCNMRIGANVDFKSMKAAGFRMLLFGIESYDQYNLDRMNKGIKKDDIIKDIKRASESGLDPHVAVMFGQPWSTEADDIATLEIVHYLLRKGFAKTAQASLYSVPTFSSIDRGYVKRIYEVGFNPEFWYNKLRSIRTLDDISYLYKQIKKGIIRD